MMLHHLWGKAKDHFDYNKEEWKTLQHQYDTMLEACRKALDCLTEETRLEWIQSQSYKEAPYHFLWEAINNATKE